MNPLTFTLPCNEAVQAARVLCLALGMVNAVLATTIMARLGLRIVVYLGLDLLIVGTEWQQLNTHSRFLVWRLPLSVALVIVSLVTLQRYASDRSH